MPRVHHVLSARKQTPVADIGEPYYWWKFRYGGKHFSKAPPRQSQLTQSAFLSGLYSLQEDIEDAPASDELGSFVERRLFGRLEELRDQSQESKDAMPEGLQEGDTGQSLESRVNAMESAIGEFESLDFDIR